MNADEALTWSRSWTVHDGQAAEIVEALSAEVERLRKALDDLDRLRAVEARACEVSAGRDESSCWSAARYILTGQRDGWTVTSSPWGTQRLESHGPPGLGAEGDASG